MKSISTALQAFLLEPTLKDGVTLVDSFGRADLISIGLPNGDSLNVVYGTNQNITYSGTTYYTSQFGAWERAAYTNTAGFRPNAGNWNLTALLPTSVTYPGTTTSMMMAVNAGMFNGATVSVQTLFWPIDGMPSDGVSMGTMKLTVGQIGNVQKTGRSKVTFEVFDMLYILNRPVPPHNIQSQCRHVLFDAGCTLTAANWVCNPVAIDFSTSTTLYLNVALPAHQLSHAYAKGDLIGVSNIPYLCTTAGTSAGSAPTFNSIRSANTTDGGAVFTSMNEAYTLGYVQFASGQNSGLKYAIKLQTTAGTEQQFQLIKPTAFTISSGDTIKLLPGCDKSIATCSGAYNNLIHFGGMPFVPNPEIGGV